MEEMEYDGMLPLMTRFFRSYHLEPFGSSSLSGGQVHVPGFKKHYQSTKLVYALSCQVD